MVYNFNGKNLTIPDNELSALMKLDLTKEEAIQTWLEDNEYLDNEEQIELDTKAKKVKIDHGASAIDKTEKKPRTPRTVKVSDEKVALFEILVGNLMENYENVDVLKENKLIQVEIGGKIFKIDLIEQRPKKN
jgi:hypothetical protein